MPNWRLSRGGLVTGGRPRSGWAFLAAAFVLAILAGSLARHILVTYAPSRRVLTAAHDLPPYARLTAADLRWATVPAAGLPGDVLTRQEQADGQVTRGLVPQGEVLRAAHLASEAGGVLALQLRGSSLRAVALPGDVVGSLLQRIAPGDRLELVAVLPVHTDKLNTTVASQVAAGAQVLEVIPPDPSGRSDDKGSVVVAVAQEEAARVALALAGGRLFVEALPAGLDRAPPLAPLAPENLVSAGGR